MLLAAAQQRTHGSQSDSLEQAFRIPPDSARPWVHWMWMDGNITRVGITADLESMQRVGIHGAVLMDITAEIPPGTVPFDGEEWHALFQHAVKEAARLGLELSMNNDPGWTGSGGPWVTPESAMQKLVWSRTNVTGPLLFDASLPALPTYQGFSRDAALVAFPTLVGDGVNVPGVKPRITGSWNPPPVASATLTDGDLSTTLSLPAPHEGKPVYLQLDFEQPYPANRLELTGGSRSQSFQGTLQARNEESRFKPIRDFASSKGNVDLRFDRTQSRSYRVVFTGSAGSLKELSLAEVALNPIYEVPSYQAKSGMARGAQNLPILADVPTYGAISLERVVDLSSELQPSGRLKWSVPPGNWTIMRFGHMPTGRKNPAARPSAIGLECDKLSREAVAAHFNAYIGKLALNSGDLAGRTFSFTHGDSWECGFQNWTPLFRQEFQSRRGYDPLPYLPACTGRLVAGSEVTERFLWDFRRTIADLFADNYAGQLAALAHQRGLKLSLEAYGNGPFDDLLYGSRADVPMSEFWNETDEDVKFHTSKCMASVAHTYGKPVVAAEAFTAWPLNGKWQNHPFTLKPLADRAFCEGVNRLVFTRFAHQPWTNLVPGMTMGMWGVHYERTQTWWEQSKPWHDYLARCQFLLQSGLFVADILYLTDEGAYTEPPQRASLIPPLPEGYDYDLAPPEVVLTRLTVRGGQLLLPDGMSYPLLVLPASRAMTPMLLEKVRDLVQAGATVVGAPPEVAPGLSAFPGSDLRVKRLAEELWGDCNGTTVLQHKLGQGRVVWGMPLAKLLEEMNLPRQFHQAAPTPKPLRFIHRRTGETDLFFLANANTNAVELDCDFRVEGKEPELWDAETGQIHPALIWRSEGATTRVRVPLVGTGSQFVIFRKPSSGAGRLTSILSGGQPVSAALVEVQDSKLTLIASSNGLYEITLAEGRVLRQNLKDLAAPLNLSSNWELNFSSNGTPAQPISLSQLVSWTKLPSVNQKYFSGSATYRKAVRMPAPVSTSDNRYYLDLGRVGVIAEISWNRKPIATLWRPPFVGDVTEAIRSGENELEVKVVNLWPNRIIGDDHLQDDCEWRSSTPGAIGTALAGWPNWLLEGRPRPSARLTFSTWKFYTKESPLLESGLLGPVTLRTVRRIPLE